MKRGSIDRRIPDQRRVIAPKGNGAPAERARGGIPMFHDIGEVVLSPNTVTNVFHYRFPTTGRLREVSARILSAADIGHVIVEVLIDGEPKYAFPITNFTGVVKLPGIIPVDEKTLVSVQISRGNGNSDVKAQMDIAYLFQEVSRAQLPPES